MVGKEDVGLHLSLKNTLDAIIINGCSLFRKAKKKYSEVHFLNTKTTWVHSKN